MSESKFKRLIVSLTVGAVLLLVFLLTLMIYQLFPINAANKEKKELMAVKAEYEQMIEDGKDTLELRSTRLWLERRARELGYRNYDDVPLG